MNLHGMLKMGNKAIGLSGWGVKSKMVMVLGVVVMVMPGSMDF